MVGEEGGGRGGLGSGRTKKKKGGGGAGGVEDIRAMIYEIEESTLTYSGNNSKRLQ